MEEQEVQFNKNLYNVFAICEDFRQRLEHLHRLKDKVVNEITTEGR
ncbi:hypothetical protein N9595_02770 [Bacteroidia bacterium]|nr:hypothetical protein [Bacteroidia bacterium]